MKEITIKIPYKDGHFFLDIADGNMVSLNAVYEMADSPANQSPPQWLRLSSTESFINSMTNENMGKSHVLKIKRGRNGGSLAHWQLALAYAQYLSPELHIVVNDVFRERLEEIANPELGISRSQERAINSWKAQGKDDKWIEERMEGKETRNNYVSTLIDHEVKPGHEVGHCTNQIYKGVLNKDRTEIELEIRRSKPGLPKNINIRDHAKRSTLAAISLSEALSSERIEEIDARGVDHCSQISLDKATSVGQMLEHERSQNKALPPAPAPIRTSDDMEQGKKHIRELRKTLGMKAKD